MAATGEPKSIVEELEAMRNLVYSYGYFDEGSYAQAAEILASLNIQAHRLETAIFNRFPDLRVAVNEGII